MLHFYLGDEVTLTTTSVVTTGKFHSLFTESVYSPLLKKAILDKDQHRQTIVYCLPTNYSNHIMTRIRIPTAGLAFGGTGLCSNRVRGVDGSCAKHLTAESYTVVMLLTVTGLLIIISIPSLLTLSFQD